MGRSDLNNIDASPPVRAQRDVMLLDDASVTSLWTPTGSATNLAATPLHVLGSQGLSFDKVAGTDAAGITRLLPGLDASSRFSASDRIEIVGFLIEGIPLDELLLRLGANADNFAQWIIPSADFSVGEWVRRDVEIAAQDVQSQVGNGMDLSNLRFIELIVRTQNANQTFEGAVFDSIVIRGV